MFRCFTSAGRLSVGFRVDHRPPPVKYRCSQRLRLTAVAYDDEGFETNVSAEKKTGVVKWFDSKKGYGFIEAADGTGDIFVHQTNIMTSGFRSLQEGESVEFVPDDSDGRIKAIQVTGPDGAAPIGTQMVDPSPFEGDKSTSSGYATEPYLELGRYSTGLQVVVHNIPWSVSADRLMEFFTDYSAVDAEVVYDDMGRSRGYGIVKFENKADAERAIEELHMRDLDGRNVIVRFDRYG